LTRLRLQAAGPLSAREAAAIAFIAENGAGLGGEAKGSVAMRGMKTTVAGDYLSYGRLP
jgi:hypothetical protein